VKTCLRCRVAKPATDFHKSSQSKDGLLGSCKDCIRVRRKEQYDPESKRAYYRANRSEIRAAQSRRYRENIDTYKERNRAYYDDTRELILLRKKQDYQRNYDRRREANRAQYAKSRARLNLLKNGPCADCDRQFPPCCMDFDHLPGTAKSAPVGNLCRSPKHKLLEEISKCELVCKVCHRLRTAARRPPRKRMNPTVEERIVFLEQAKARSCADCGQTHSPSAMDFHHIDSSTKSKGIAALVRQASRKRLEEEIRKCVLLCANCHALRHSH